MVSVRFSGTVLQPLCRSYVFDNLVVMNRAIIGSTVILHSHHNFQWASWYMLYCLLVIIYDSLYDAPNAGNKVYREKRLFSFAIR